jgi:hypothetical protein
MTTLYEQINTRKIVLPPELQEFFATIYDTSKKYEFVYLGKNLAWKPLIASRAPSSEIHKKEEDILILKFLDEKFWGSEYAIAKQDWGFSQPIVFVPDPYKDNEVRKVSRVERGTKFEVYAVVGTKTKYYTSKDGDLKHNVEASDLPILKALAGKNGKDLYESLTSILGGNPTWIYKILGKLCSAIFNTKIRFGYSDFIIPKEFGRDLETSKEIFNYFTIYCKETYYEKMVPAIKILRKKEKELDSNAYAVYRFLLLTQTIMDKI